MGRLKLKKLINGYDKIFKKISKDCSPEEREKIEEDAKEFVEFSNALSYCKETATSIEDIKFRGGC